MLRFRKFCKMIFLKFVSMLRRNVRNSEVSTFTVVVNLPVKFYIYRYVYAKQYKPVLLVQTESLFIMFSAVTMLSVYSR